MSLLLVVAFYRRKKQNRVRIAQWDEEERIRLEQLRLEQERLLAMREAWIRTETERYASTLN